MRPLPAQHFGVAVYALLRGKSVVVKVLVRFVCLSLDKRMVSAAGTRVHAQAPKTEHAAAEDEFLKEVKVIAKLIGCVRVTWLIDAPGQRSVTSLLCRCCA